MAQRWSVGIIGCGRMAGTYDAPGSSAPIESHAQAYAQHPRFRLIAAMDPNEQRLQRFQRAWDVPRGYASLDEFLAIESCEVISVCSPTPCHVPQAMQIMEAAHRPRVLFVEKPLCGHPDEMRQLRDRAEATGVRVLVNHTRRFDPIHQELASLICSGALGALLGGRCTYYGGWLNNGTHVVDTVRLLFDSPIEVASSAVVAGGREGDENLTVRARCAGATLVLEAIEETHYKLLEFEFRFEQGRARLLDAGERIIVDRVQVNRYGERVLVPAEGFPRLGLMNPLAHAVDAIAAILGGEDRGRALGVDLAAASETMALVWQAQELAMPQVAG
ncbi:MAG: Gfo/Idh/MocA family oxidoreductase [Candidatus Omnitrophica bacterium]|nr:Gfo/Idh/MocA family oxidoreductase [Candidatus Omnitrophota bacterium]